MLAGRSRAPISAPASASRSSARSTCRSPASGARSKRTQSFHSICRPCAVSVMSSSQIASPEIPLGIARLSPFRLVKRVLPRGLFWRSLIIIVAPVVLLQAIVSYVFFERDVDTTTRWMARDVAADVGFLVAIEDNTAPAERASLRQLSARMLGYEVRFLPGQKLPAQRPRHRFTSIDAALDAVIEQQLGGGRHFRSRRVGNDRVGISVEVHDGVLDMIVPRNRMFVSKPDIFILWMVGSAFMLTGIAIVFLRNQVRPIERLSLAADAFGKGRAVPDFKPYGASEVRRAARAFLTMRERIERHVQQRTEMLAGVSHDLKTPLTRMKLSLAMMDESADIAALREDIAEMEHMLDEYLEFARGESGEQAVPTELNELVRDAAHAAARARSAEDGRVAVILPEAIVVTARRNALKRCIINIVDNALKFGTKISVTLQRMPRHAEIVVDDNGPGIAESA